MIQAFFATKLKTTQTWDKTGKRLPVTLVSTPSLVITQIKSNKTDGYSALQLAVSKKRSTTNKPQAGHLNKSNSKSPIKIIGEILTTPEDLELYKVGDNITIDQIFNAGDKVSVTGVSKGRGFTGVMKRWGFHGGPRTHGQSDRERAPGSIGQGTTPGRVYKGKKMAGRSGNQQTTLRNLIVAQVDQQNSQLLVTGTLPGHFGSTVKITKTGPSKFPGLISDSKQVQEPQPPTDEAAKKTTTKSSKSEK